jgi:hypothetical protein
VPANGTCQPKDGSYKNKSQGYIRFGGPWAAAGVYQAVQVTPCTYYRFEVYNRNDNNNYNARVAIEPYGWVFPFKPDEPKPPDNCPPDGRSVCPHPNIDHWSEFSSAAVWSPVSNHAAFTWVPLSVTAEALSTTLSVWTVTAPEPTESNSRSTYWDYASLVQAPPPAGTSLAAPGALPAPDGKITGIIITASLTATALQWQTPAPAHSQVLYHYAGSSAATNLPPIADSTEKFESRLPISDAQATHRFRIENLVPASTYDVALLSRQWNGTQCQTSVQVIRIQTLGTLTSGPLSTNGEISSVITATAYSTATVQWQTTHPAYSQILYHYVGSAASTNLPPIVNNTNLYEGKTGITIPANTAHLVKMRQLLPYSAYDIALLSCQLVNDQCQLSVYLTRIKTTDMLITPGRLPAPSRDIIGLTVLPLEHSAYVIWQSAQPAFAQVLYSYEPPITYTTYPSRTYTYLPLILAHNNNYGVTYKYEYRTLPTTQLSTLHIIHLTKLLTESQYSLVALSAWSEGEQDKVAVSAQAVFRTQSEPVQMAANISPDQLAEQLQVCLAGEKKLTTCIDTLAR